MMSTKKSMIASEMASALCNFWVATHCALSTAALLQYALGFCLQRKIQAKRKELVHPMMVAIIAQDIHLNHLGALG